MSVVKSRTLSVSDLNTELTKDEPRIRDVRIGERLGFERPRKIRDLIKRNLAELQAYGSMPHHGAMVEIGSKAKRSVEEYWLNEAQALLLCMFARTDKAAEVRKEVIEVYLAARYNQAALGSGQPSSLRPASLTNAQRRTIQQMIRERWSNNDERRTAYDRLKERFDVARYWHIEKERFREAVDFILCDSDAPDANPSEIRLRLPIERPELVFDEATGIAEALYMARDCPTLVEALYVNVQQAEGVLGDIRRNLAALRGRMQHARLCTGKFLVSE